MKTLILSNVFLPVGVQNWKKAIKKVFLQKAELVEKYDVEIYKGVFVPAVIRLTRYVNPEFSLKKYKPYNRKNLWIRDGGRCQYCGEKVSKKNMTVDHIRPKVLGGKTTWENTVTCCPKCNKRKGSQTPEQSGMKLLSMPIAPSINKNGSGLDIYLYLSGYDDKYLEKWKPFLFLLK